MPRLPPRRRRRTGAAPGLEPQDAGERWRGFAWRRDLFFAIVRAGTLNCDPNWLSGFSPRIASIATRALNFGLYCFLVVLIDLSFVNDSAEILAYCLV